VNQESGHDAQQDATISAVFAQMSEEELFPDRDEDEYDVEAGLQQFRVWLDTTQTKTPEPEPASATAQSAQSPLRVHNFHGSLAIEAPRPTGGLAAGYVPSDIARELLGYQERRKHVQLRGLMAVTAVLFVTVSASIVVAAAHPLIWQQAVVMLAVNVIVGTVGILSYRIFAHDQVIALFQAAVAGETPRSAMRPPAGPGPDSSSGDPDNTMVASLPDAPAASKPREKRLGKLRGFLLESGLISAATLAVFASTAVLAAIGFSWKASSDADQVARFIFPGAISVFIGVSAAVAYRDVRSIMAMVKKIRLESKESQEEHELWP
jgi:hypothetical protein